MAYLKRWQVEKVFVQTSSDEETLDEFLQLGWDPFAVTFNGIGWDYHLKRFGYESIEDE